jgi:hypothetical protein
LANDYLNVTLRVNIILKKKHLKFDNLEILEISTKTNLNLENSKYMTNFKTKKIKNKIEKILKTQKPTNIKNPAQKAKTQ